MFLFVSLVLGGFTKGSFSIFVSKKNWNFLGNTDVDPEGKCGIENNLISIKISKNF